MKDIEIEIMNTVHVLPPEKQVEVLDFVKKIEVSKNGQKTDEEKAKERHERLMSLVGIGRSKSGNVSERVDEILAEGINKREGWSLP